MEKQHEVYKFYCSQRSRLNRAGFSYRHLFLWSLIKLEQRHDYIQWYFPLLEPSVCQTQSPVLLPKDVNTLRRSAAPQLQRRAFRKMLRFLGLRTRGKTIIRANTFGLRSQVWISPNRQYNHNYLRISRILSSLRLLGNRELSKMLYSFLLENKQLFPEATMEFWKLTQA